MTTFCQQAADEAAEAAQQDRHGMIGTGSQNGKTNVTRNVGGAYIYDKDGHVIASVSLTIVAHFSEKEGEEGKFLGAELVIQTFKSDKDGNVSLGEDPTTKTIPISYGQAARAFGANSMAATADSAATNKLFFLREVAHDPHALVHAGSAGLGFACLLTPCAEALVGAAAIVESANFLWEQLEKQ
jgi:hypothetical protein